MEFERRKAATLASLASSVTDKSPKGTLDAPIVHLIETLNSHPSFFTTSSCSGRISILSTPRLPQPSNKNKARGGTWLYVTHSPAPPCSLLPLLFPPACSDWGQLVFRFEPFILAVECRDVEWARELVSLAVRTGFRESGITSIGKKGGGRVIVGVRCSIRMEVPLGEDGKVLVGEEYVRFLVQLANGKMEENRRRYEGFLEAFNEEMLVREENNGGGNRVDFGEGAHNEDVQIGLVGSPSCDLSVGRIVIGGEPLEKLYLWGHSACVLDHENCNGIFVFGGFGGMGRHARRNDCLLLDPLIGTLRTMRLQGTVPSPRLGHSASLVGNRVFVIGGRADPLNILSDVWVFDVVEKVWKLLQCSGGYFQARHRHAAAVVGLNIYVFGGLNNEKIFSSLFVFNTKSLEWKEVPVRGEQPLARHSHSMVAHQSKLFVFGGYNGEKAFGDLYSFDVQTNIWKKEETIGRSPHARFSHSMFVYRNFLGLIGGCPVRQHFHELTVFDLQYKTWRHFTLDFIDKELLVRSTTNIVGDDLVIIGGGAACYAFGTKFSEPLKIHLVPLVSSTKEHKPLETWEDLDADQYNGVRGENNVNTKVGIGETLCQSPESFSDFRKHEQVASHWLLKIERQYAKFGKDILKKFGWLDLGRKVQSKEGGSHICFPITKKFCALFSDVCEKQNCVHLAKSSAAENVLQSTVSSSTALNLLRDCGAEVLVDEIVESRQTVKSHFQRMREAVASLIKDKGLPEQLLEHLPTRWERLGDVVVLPVTSFKDPGWESIGEELWPTIARSLNCCRLARQGRVASTGTRDSTLEVLLGDDGWVNHRENGIFYSFDATKCMFSWGNLSEKLRMGNLNCKNEVIVDLFAGIGYFVLPFLVRAKAKLVYACEWNAHAVEALKHNLKLNLVSERCNVLEGDNRETAPKGVADRVCLGLLPTSEGSWVTAVRALRNEGGVLHVHGNVKDIEEGSWTKHVLRSFDEIAKSEGHSWEISIEHVERVKWYAPHIRHIVVDVRCQQLPR